MASQTVICNMALAMLGKDPIVTITEDSMAARTCAACWNTTLEALLRSHTWSCAISRANLQRLEAAPAYGYDYQYQLPNDCLRVMDIDGEDYDFQIERDVIMTDATSVSIRYIASIGANYFDSTFAQLMALSLAYTMAYPLTQNATLHNTLQEMLERATLRAKLIDGQEGIYRQIYGADEHLLARM